MGTKGPSGEPDFQRQLSELADKVAENHAKIDALGRRADEAQARADESESRADQAQLRADEAERRADETESRADENHLRIDVLETRADVDREIIRALEAEGLLSREHAAHLEEALRSSRTIGAALGIIMADRKVNEIDAFAALSRASQNANRKVRVLADDIVATGDVSRLFVL